MPEAQIRSADELRLRRHREAALLLKRWSVEDPAYDERTGEALERELKDGGMRCEERDETPS
jgi:hypothetical protein